MNRDPIGYEGSEWNLFEYISGNPGGGLDPTGLAGSDIRDFDYVVDHLKLSRKGATELHKYLADVKDLPGWKGRGPTARKAALMAAGREIKALGGSYVLKAFGGVAFFAASFLRDIEGTAYGMEWKGWRDTAYKGDRKCPCFCSAYSSRYFLPTWWNVVGMEEEFLPPSRSSEIVYLGFITAQECASKETPPLAYIREDISSYFGTIVADVHQVKCTWDQPLYGRPGTGLLR